jgi:hypothetical protein
LKIPNTKSTGGVAEGVGSEFKTQYHKEKKKQRRKGKRKKEVGGRRTK